MIIVKKWSLLVFGSIIMGFGVALALQGGYGCDPLAMFWEGLTLHFPISLGIANLLVSFVLIIIAIIIDKKQISIGTIINPIVLSLSTDIFMTILTPMSPSLRLFQSIIGVLIMGSGIGLYTTSELGKGAYDAVVFGVCQRYQIQLYIVRTCFDIGLLVSSIFLGAHFGIATIVAVLCVGKVIQYVHQFIKTKIIS